MVDLGPAERAVLGEDEMARVEALCLCPGCPSFPAEDAGVKKAYCLRGDSDHRDQIEPKDCLCEQCEIYKHGKLYGSNYFCIVGAAMAKGMRNVLQGDPITRLVREREGDPIFVSAGNDVHRPG